MSNRLLVISPDNALVGALKSALDTATSLLQIEHLPENEDHICEKFQPSGILIDSDSRSGVQTAFERIAAARRQFPAIPVIALGNEMSAQLVLAALRAGADDFVDREASCEQIQAAIRNCLAQNREPRRQGRARMAAVLSPFPSEQDQDFALNLAVRAAAQTRDRLALYIDLSLPVTQAGVALGIDLKFSVADAIRELGRLDRVLLEGAVARDSRSSLYVMALSNDFKSDAAALEPATFTALLQILQNIFDIVVINYGPFSRQRALLEMLQPDAQMFLCCSQRFSSVRGAGDLLDWLGESERLARPQLVIHEMAPGQVPSPAEIRDVLKVSSSIDVGASWDELAAHLNRASPMALAASSRYGRALDLCLAQMGVAPEPRPAFTSKMRAWLRLAPEAVAT